ncbi:MAG: ABC transporter permease [Planctomycetes bacterium]|nr:ABC transporter permease [Planctomycetota bacterium]
MAQKNAIDVRKQKKLSLGRSLKICLRGMTHRLLRSTLTLAVVVLAVAFFMTLLTENVFIASIAAGAGNEITLQREASVTLNFLYVAPADLIHSKRLATTWESSNETQLALYAKFTATPIEEIRQLAKLALQEQQYLEFFNSLSVGKRLILVQKNQGRKQFRFLINPGPWQEFVENIKVFKSLQVPGGIAEMRSFLDGFETYTKKLAKVTAAWHDSIKTFTAASEKITGPDQIDDWLATAKANELTAWLKTVQGFGFDFSQEKLDRICKFLKIEKRRAEIATILNSATKKDLWQKTLYTKPALDEKMVMLTNDKVADTILESKFNREDLQEIVNHIKHERVLAQQEANLVGKTNMEKGELLSEKQLFLLFVSFLVCIVGIANAMLMSITERFREIATMKCLGATDGFILTQFLFEAAIQGAVGGIIGVIIGFALSLLKNSVTFGSYLYHYFPGEGLLLCGLYSLAAGIILSMVASIYPSWAASRMAPMEAMRIE